MNNQDSNYPPPGQILFNSDKTMNCLSLQLSQMPSVNPFAIKQKAQVPDQEAIDPDL